ncbi:MAG: ATPase, partial [Chloroflexi bacterium]
KLHNVYRERDKSLPPSRCIQCGALFSEGRWTWDQPPAEVGETVCPACRRTADNFPAGYVELSGPFFMEHRQEIMNLITNTEQKEKAERPLERIMSIINEADHTLITTTGIHVARRLGEAMAKAYKGELNIQYADGEKLVRVYWQR